MDIVDSFQTIPICTRTWLGLTIAITAAIAMDIIPLQQITLDWNRIGSIFSIGVRHDHYYERPELWRLITSFCCCRSSSQNQVNALIELFFMYTMGSGYEVNPFPAGSESRSADTLFVMIICAIAILCTHSIPEYVLGRSYRMYPILTRNFSSAILYLFTKRNPRTVIRLQYFLPVEGRYLPFVQIGLSYAMGYRLRETLHGYAVGHLCYFIVAVSPAVLGRRVLRTPRILVELVGDQGGMIPEEAHDAIPPPMHEPNDDRATPAHIAAKHGILLDLQQLVDETSTNAGGHRRHRLLTAADRNGWQPLHEACRGGYMDIVEYLVVDQRQYIDINARTNGGDTPLSLSETFHGPNHPVTQLLQEVSN